MQFAQEFAASVERHCDVSDGTAVAEGAGLPARKTVGNRSSGAA